MGIDPPKMNSMRTNLLLVVTVAGVAANWKCSVTTPNMCGNFRTTRMAKCPAGQAILDREAAAGHRHALFWLLEGTTGCDLSFSSNARWAKTQCKSDFNLPEGTGAQVVCEWTRPSAPTVSRKARKDDCNCNPYIQ